MLLYVPYTYVCTVLSVYCTKVSVYVYIIILAMMVLYRQEITQLEDKIHGARERYKENITTSGEDSISAIPKVCPYYICQCNDRVYVAILGHIIYPWLCMKCVRTYVEY